MNTQEENMDRIPWFLRRPFLTGVATLAIVLALALPALADGPGAVAWLKTQQNADGGWGSPVSTMGATADVLLAAVAVSENGLAWANGGPTALAYLEANAASLTKAGDIAKVTLALTASGKTPRDLNGIDLIAKLESMAGQDGKIGGDNDFINEHCYAIIALKSARRTIPASSVEYLLSRQIADGTWSWNGGTTAGSGDNNTAAMAVIALAAAGVPANNAQIQKTLAHFAAQQNEDGGFPYIKPSPYGTDSDANSTAVVMWAILAAGQDPAGTDWKYQGQDGHSALDRMRAFQNASGAFRWQDAMPDDNFASTIQAAIAVESKTLPFASMDVGQPAAPATTAAPASPETLPVTGAAPWLSLEPSIVAGALLTSGLSLAGIGIYLRRKR
jgi:hypothetical protein